MVWSQCGKFPTKPEFQFFGCFQKMERIMNIIRILGDVIFPCRRSIHRNGNENWPPPTDIHRAAKGVVQSFVVNAGIKTFDEEVTVAIPWHSLDSRFEFSAPCLILRTHAYIINYIYTYIYDINNHERWYK